MNRNRKEYYRDTITQKHQANFVTPSTHDLTNLPLNKMAIFSGKCLGGKVTPNSVIVYNKDGHWFVTDNGQLAEKDYRNIISFLESTC